MSHQKNLSKLQAHLADRGVPKDKNFDSYQDYIEQKEETTSIKLFGRTLVAEGSVHLASGRVTSTKKFKL